MRGNLWIAESLRYQRGSIPARAGEPGWNAAKRRHHRVYPRACGGTSGAITVCATSAGITTWVYPRACGGTAVISSSASEKEGLSPRVRGNRLLMNLGALVTRSIPARAGEPDGVIFSLDTGPVYPRACGGTRGVHNGVPAFTGLSPRVRGNRPIPLRNRILTRSIPARAGEPRRPCCDRCRRRVYPRACGGTAGRKVSPSIWPGLSPRVRGNHTRGFAAMSGSRSIPARAGEPGWPTPAENNWRVYPRACGGTTSAATGALPGAGLSPRVRGNRCYSRASSVSFRSIPARAGEPPNANQTDYEVRVYPRACGGTRPRAITTYRSPGLSPRVRGNRHRPFQRHDVRGSIPARAGEPDCAALYRITRRVYPRACGGTGCRALPGPG